MRLPEVMGKAAQMSEVAASGDLDQLYGMQGELVAYLLGQSRPRT